MALTRRRSIPKGSWNKIVSKNVPSLNTFLLKELRYQGFWDIPKLYPTQTIPKKLCSYSNRHRWKPGLGAFHFYVEDVRFNNLWTSLKTPPHMPKVIRECGVCIAPDFSVYIDWPMSMNLWNIYRARVIGAFWQGLGIDVIPSLQWGDINALGAVLWSGMPKNSVLSISTSHCKGEYEEKIWKDFYLATTDLLNPTHIIIYGRGFKGWLEDQPTPITRFDSDITKVYYEKKLSFRQNMVDHCQY